MSSATSNMRFNFFVLKEDGGPNFNPAGKFFTEDSGNDEYGTLALGCPMAAATIHIYFYMNHQDSYHWSKAAGLQFNQYCRYCV